jgi:hypothetical protein
MKHLPMTIFISIALIFDPLSSVEIVSLGSACNIALTVRRHGLRTTAYPFDWTITSMQALIKGFQDDFKNVLLSEESHESNENRSIEDGYGLKFAHAFPTVNPVFYGDVDLSFSSIVPHWRNSLEQVRTTFNRRLERLLQLLKTGVPVILARYDDHIHYTTRDEAEQLILVLKDKFPHAKVTLVFIGNTPNFQECWHLPNTQTIFIKGKDCTSRQDPEWTSTILSLTKIEPQPWPSTNTNKTDVHVPNHAMKQ